MINGNYCTRLGRWCTIFIVFGCFGTPWTFCRFHIRQAKHAGIAHVANFEFITPCRAIFCNLRKETWPKRWCTRSSSAGRLSILSSSSIIMWARCSFVVVVTSKCVVTGFDQSVIVSCCCNCGTATGMASSLTSV